MAAPARTKPPRAADAADLRRVLEETHPFSALDGAGLDALACVCRVRRLAPRELLQEDGVPVRSAFVLTRGRLTRSLCTSEGRRIMLNNTYPVTALCLACALDGTPHLGVIEAAVASEVVVVPMAALRERLDGSLPFARALVEWLARSSVKQTKTIQELIYPVPVRVARYLCRATSPDGRGTLEVSKTTIAEMLGIAPETLSRTLATLREKGLVDVEGRTVRVLDRVALASFAQL